MFEERDGARIDGPTLAGDRRWTAGSDAADRMGRKRAGEDARGS